MIASMTAVILATGSAANATVYHFTFDSPFESIIGQLTVDTSNNQVTNITGTLSGIVNDTINGFIATSSFPNAVSLPDGAFMYDNVFYPGQDSLVDQYGVVFTTAGNPGGYWNLWSDAPGNYLLDESNLAGDYRRSDTAHVDARLIGDARLIDDYDNAKYGSREGKDFLFYLDLL